MKIEKYKKNDKSDTYNRIKMVINIRQFLQKFVLMIPLFLIKLHKNLGMFNTHQRLKY